MKKILILVAAIGVMYSCGNRDKRDVIETETVTVERVDTHNAKNSLDVDGTYKGVIPAADDSGITVTITLSGDNYTKTAVFDSHPSDVFKTEGKIRWNNEGNEITLTSDEKANQYFVAENQLIALDTDGKRIEGDLADKYVLKKVN